jgi:hypothetical protein
MSGGGNRQARRALNTIEIEENLDRLVSRVSSGDCPLHDFPFGVMEAYGSPRNEIAKLRMKHPEALISTDILWPKKLLFRAAAPGTAQRTMDELKLSVLADAKIKNWPRFLVCTDGEEFLALDTKSRETPRFDRLAELPVNYDFLLPMFGVERYQPAPETTADVRAARHMAKFHDAIRDANPDWGADRIHDLNLFMTRILFSMFAEDTGIFADGLFLSTLRREAMQIDGSDTKRVIEDIFLSLDVADRDQRRDRGVRSQRIAADFPYVNGGLFRDRTEVPVFNRRARRLLLEAADLHWDQIHADIFGSMIQAIVQTDMRADFGMHYTSVPNIMKVLEPLFLGSLREQLTAAGDNAKALEKLVDRISRIRVFDPACGSGNFLIIAYRELRLIETEAFKRMRDVKRKGQLPLADYRSGIRISSFYGIDPVDFACETSKLSLWISQYQMNKNLDEICSAPTPALPLTDAGSIFVGNALYTPWADVCPPNDEGEIFIVGNPPYLGRAQQTEQQKQEIAHVFSESKTKFKKLDYVACWFELASQYLAVAGSAASFVATNSICQGEQVSLLWPSISQRGIEIGFAYSSFRWRNSAAGNAAVVCVIIGLRRRSTEQKRIYSAKTIVSVSNINAYLTDAPDVFVRPVQTSISSLPVMNFGNQPIDDGNLILDLDEAKRIVSQYPDAARFIRMLYGSREYINSSPRACLWISDEDRVEAESIPPIAERVERTRLFRLSSDRAETQEQAKNAHRFVFIPCAPTTCLIVPSVSSDRRTYLPVGFLDDQAIVTNLAFTIYDAPAWVFSIIASALHLAWTRSVGGRLKTDPRYSNTLVYNTFPMPTLSLDQKSNLEDHALAILRIREPYIADGRTIAWLYNPETMPADLLEAHHELDAYFETIYIGRPFKDDVERLEHLFKLYARMTKTAAKAA